MRSAVGSPAQGPRSDAQLASGSRRAEAIEVNLRLRDAAEADIGDAHAWYRERGHDLGDQFLGALDQCLESIQRNPLAFPAVHGEVRRALLRKFPVSASVMPDRTYLRASLEGEKPSDSEVQTCG